MSGATKSPAAAAESLSLPSNWEAEAQLLGTIAIDQVAALEACDHLDGSEFHLDGHRALFRAVRAEVKAGGGLALLAIAQRIEADPIAADAVKGLEPDGAAVYLTRLMDYSGRLDSIPRLCAMIADLHTQRQLINGAERIAEDARKSGADLAGLVGKLRDTLENVEAGTGGADELVRLALGGPEFMAQDFPEPKSLLGASLLCEGGGAILHAPAGEGKSFLGEQLAYAVASGERWLGMFGTPKDGVPVVLIQAELSSYHVQQRRRASPIYRASPPKLRTLTYQQLGRQLDILDLRDFSKLVRLVRQTGARLLVVDPLSQFHSEAESPEGFSKVRHAVQDLILRTGCAVLLIHHEAKSSNDPKLKRSAADRVRGAGILVRDWGELQMALEADPAGHHRLHFAKARHSQKPGDLYLKQNDGWWEPTEPPVLIGNKTDEALERALLTGPEAGLTKDQLIAASIRDGGAKTGDAINDALDRLAGKWGLESRQAFNVGTPNRPRYVYGGGMVGAGGSLLDSHEDEDCGTTS